MADAPVEALLARVDDLAKGWLLELVDQAPLAQAASILAGELASTGPRLCEAVIRALAADTALAAIEPGGPLAPLAAQVGRLAGAEELADVSRAVDALMAVLWSAMRSELRDPEAELVSELAERLAHVIEAIRGAALARAADSPRVVDPQRSAMAWPSSPRRARAPDARRGADVSPPADPAPAPTAPSEVSEPAGAEAVGPNGVTPAAPAVPRRHLDEMSADSRIRSWPGGLEPPPRHRAARSEALWVGAIDDEIERAENSGAALSLLLVELEDADRVLAVEDPGEASMTFRRFAQAVRTVVRRQDILACESDSRAWIIAPGSNRVAARALGSRIEHAVRAEPPWRGAPMTISVGLSVLGEDGRESATLMDVAEEGRFAATAEGVGVHGGDPAAPEPSPRGGPRRID
ncbi:MAG: hypothetical protein M3Z06_14650 [Actinomycetota bacterium]|nr:hypothetical protein [Actinomycetota bacterium]